MHADSHRPKRKVSHVFRKIERCKGDRERKMGEGRLSSANTCKITHIQRDAGYKHDHRQSVKELSSRIDTQCR